MNPEWFIQLNQLTLIKLCVKHAYAFLRQVCEVCAIKSTKCCTVLNPAFANPDKFS